MVLIVCETSTHTPCSWAQELHLVSGQGFSPCLSDVQDLPVCSSVTYPCVGMEIAYWSRPWPIDSLPAWTQMFVITMKLLVNHDYVWLPLPSLDPILACRLTSWLRIVPPSSLQACLVIWTLAWPWLTSLFCLPCLHAVGLGPWLVRSMPCRLWCLPQLLALGP